MTRSEEALWDRVYRFAATEYTRIPKYYDADARLTADAAVAGWFRGGRRRQLMGLSRTPRFGDLLNLTPYARGEFRGVEWVYPNGEIGGAHFVDDERHNLLWSDDLQAAFVFPAMTQGPCVYPPTVREDALARMWAKGRGARCSARAQIPELLPLPYAYPALQVSYRSDKFSHGTMRNYIHHHGPGVVVYFSDSPRGPRAPRIIMIRGGRLRLTSHGIDG